LCSRMEVVYCIYTYRLHWLAHGSCTPGALGPPDSPRSLGIASGIRTQTMRLYTSYVHTYAGTHCVFLTIAQSLPPPSPPTSSTQHRTTRWTALLVRKRWWKATHPSCFQQATLTIIFVIKWVAKEIRCLCTTLLQIHNLHL
jgi:hypothetical protein